VRVLLVHNRYRSVQPSGENAVVEDEARFLEEAGCAVHRLEMHSDEIAGWPFRKRALVPGRVVWSQEGYRLTAAAIRSFRPDVVHVHNTFPLLSPAALWAARRSGAGVVQTLHNFRPLCVAGNFFRDGHVCELCLGRVPLPALVHGCYRSSRAATLPLALKNGVHSLLRTWARCVDVFVAPSEFARRKYVEAGWPESKIVVKYNTAPDVGSTEGQWHGSFAYVGRFGTEKGTDLLLSAWADAFPRGGPGLRMIGADEGASGEGAAAPSGVEFFGHVERSRALALVAGSQALIVPSRLYEVFPRVIVEAYALGVPVIASNVGPLPEIVEHGRTGLVVKAGETTELAQALRALASTDEASRELGREARLVYERKYSPSRTTERLLEIYADVAAKATAA
jgi:glycosyltransferase involved in cell wall biosynthesis